MLSGEADDIGLDGAVVLVLPGFVIALLDWHADTINSVFVGIVSPHLVRRWVNHDPARSLLPSALLAGLFLVVADIGVRLLPTSSELKLGGVAALLGAPVFIWIAARRRVSP